MQNKKIFILLLIIIPITVSAQVGGISASKLGTYCTSTIAKKSIEFEPVFGVDVVKKQWNNNGKRCEFYQNNEADYFISSGFGFRMTYGVSKNFELGMAFPVNFEKTDIGFKVLLFEHNKISFSVMGGSSLNISERGVVQKENPVFDSFSEGIISTYNFTDNLSIDINTQFVQNTVNNTVKKIILANADLGWYINENFQFIGGFYYQTQKDEISGYRAFSLSINPGFCIETGEQFLLVINSPIGLAGRNTEIINAFQLALTITLE